MIVTIDIFGRRRQPNRQVTWAKKKRLELIARLGGKCALCGAGEKLEIDHINGCDWLLSGKSSHARVIHYRREAERGLLRVLCRSCNARRNSRQPVTPESQSEPCGDAPLADDQEPF